MMGKRPAGFTLLEVLLASILLAALLASLWALMAMHVRLFATGHSETERAQLVRNVAQMVSDDLLHTVYRSDPGDEAGVGRVQVPRLPTGLYGSSDSLTLHVVRIHPGNLGRPNEVLPADEPWRPDVPELRTVVYSAGNTLATSEKDSPGEPGLVRQAFATAAVHGEAYGLNPTGRPAISSGGAMRQPRDRMTPRRPMDQRPMDQRRITGGDDDVQTVHASEIEAIRFRYFDGTAWHTYWDMAQRESLPTAVEVSLAMRPTDEGESVGHAPRRSRRSARTSFEILTTVHRFVIHLPTAAKPQPPVVARTSRP